jgi:hypothetical protein
MNTDKNNIFAFGEEKLIGNRLHLFKDALPPPGGYK